MGKGHLVPLPELACLCVCCVPSPDLLLPFSFSLRSLHLYICVSFRVFRSSSLKVLVGVPLTLHTPLAGFRVGRFCYQGQRPQQAGFLGFPERVRTMAGRTLALRYGPPWSPIPEKEVVGNWPNWRLTSSGVAHHRIPLAPFPPPTLQVRGWRVTRRERGQFTNLCARRKEDEGYVSV